MRKHLRVFLLAVSLMLTGLTGIIGGAGTAWADTTPLYSGSAWLGGNGVNVCPASTDTTCGGQMHVGGASTNWWQCVELAQRLYKNQGWYNGIFSGVSIATDIYNNAANLGFTTQANGSITSIAPGDMIVSSGSKYDDYAGHVAIVNSLDLANNKVNAVEQNTYNNMPTTSYGFSNGTLTRTDGATGPVMGLVHSPKDTLTGSTPPPPVSDHWPVALTASDGSLNIFANSGDLYQDVWTTSGVWTGWIDRNSNGAGFVGSPYAFKAADGGLNVFDFSNSGHMYQNVWTASAGWTGWIDRTGITGGFAGSPNVVAKSDGSMNIFGIGGDGHLWQQVYTPSGGWTGWIDRGWASLTGSAYAAADSSGDLNVFANASNGHVYQDVWTPAGGWTGLIDRGGVTGLIGSPIAHVNSDGSLNIFVLGAGHLYQDVWSPSGGWTGWIDRGSNGGGFVGSPFVTFASDGSFNIFTDASNGHAFQQVWSPSGGWSGWIDRASVTGGFVGSPYVLVNPDGSMNVFYIGSSHVWQNVWTPSGGWTGWLDKGTAGSGF